jgi:hypothetical protein
MLKNEVLSYHRSLPKLQTAEMEIRKPKDPYSERHLAPGHPDLRPHTGRPVVLPTRDRDRSRSRHRPMSPEPIRGQTNELPRLPSTDLVPFTMQTPAEIKTSQKDLPAPQLRRHSRDETTDDDQDIVPPMRHIGVDNQPRRTEHRSATKEQSLSQRLIAATPYDPVRNLHPPRLLIGPGGPTGAERYGGDQPQGEKPGAEASSAVKQLLLGWTKVNPALLGDLLIDDGSIPEWGPAPRE